MNELKKVEENRAMSPVEMTQYAIQQGATPEQLLQYMQLQERAEANEAKRAYHVAMNAFKANPPEILKNSTVSYDNSDGSQTTYKHASLDHVCSKVSEALSAHGLSHHWDTNQIDGGQIQVTCVITHVLGHSESVTLQSGPDQSGKKNNIQAVGSTVTYLQRYTLLSAAGCSAKGMDDDGKKSEPEQEPITNDQCNTIHALVTDNELGADRLDKLIKSCYHIDDLADLPASQYKSIISKINTAIEAKRESEK